jgi:hypothetical protein
VTTSMTIARPALGALLALALAPALWPGEAAAHTCDDPFATDLIAGRTIDAGDVEVCNDDTTLTVTYEATFPWCLLKTDLHVATSKSGIPQNKNGHPTPGKFADGEEYGGCLDGSATFEIPLDEIDGGVEPEDTVFIAAHAEVEDGAREEGAWGKGTRFVERGNWAMYFTYEVQAAPPPTSCVCDSGTAPSGATGASILAQLCPGGLRVADAVFTDVPSVTSVMLPSSGVGYGVFQRGPECVLTDAPRLGSGYVLSVAEFNDCQAHLRVSCGQP